MKEDHAGFGIRFAARLIDTVLVFVAQVLIFIVLLFASIAGGAFVAAEAGAGASIWQGLFGAIMIFVWLFSAHIYFIVMHKKFGQTVGKMLLKIKVTKTNGNPLGWKDAILREIGELISAFPLLLGYIWIAIDKEKQGWHDKIAKTYVVRQKQ